MIDSKTIKSATLWSILETSASFMLGIVSILFLAKLLSPEDYGQIATAQLLSALIQIVLSCGLSDAIIQKKEIKEPDIQTFWSFSCILSVGAFLICGVISYLFFITDKVILSYIMFFEGIVASLTLLTIIPSALVYKTLKIKRLTLMSIVAKIIFFAVAIPLALSNFGLWSVVYGNLIQSIAYCVLILITMRSLIPRSFSIQKSILFQSLNFGFYVMLESLLWSVLSRVLGLLIAAFHGAAALGLYNMATKFTDTILSILNMTITRLTLPIFSSVQTDNKLLLQSFQKMTFYFNMLSMPAFFGMAVTAEYWVPLLLGNKWVEVIPVVQIISVMYGFMYSRIFVGTVIKSLGRSKEFLYLSVVAAVITLVAIFFTRDIDLVATLLAMSIPRVVITIPLGIYLMYKICRFGVSDQIQPIYIPTMSTIVIMISVYLIQYYLPEVTWFNFIAQLVVGSIAFSVLTLLSVKKYQNKLGGSS